MTDPTLIPSSSAAAERDALAAWQVALGDLRQQMSRVDFETWISPLQPLGCVDGVFTLGAHNDYARQWAETRLSATLTRLLQGIMNQPVSVAVVNLYDYIPASEANQPQPAPAQAPAEAEPTSPGSRSTSRSTPEGSIEGSQEPPEAKPAKAQPVPASPRKLMLQRAYGSQRAAIIQPERALFLTLYFFQNWTPLIGHSAVAVILAARSLCYWNPKTGELRNTIETEMGELAQRASVSLRTVKDVLKNELVQQHFLRYRVRRIMTSAGVRTAGIVLQVRMDDPLTPEDQAAHNLPEEERWFSADFELEEEGE